MLLSVIEDALSMKYGSLVMPMSIIGGAPSEEGVDAEAGDEVKPERSSSAVNVIIISRSSKSAGLGFLSAFTVARRNNTLGLDWDPESESDPVLFCPDFKAVLTRLKCALDGGLKLESSTYSVRIGDEEGGDVVGMVRRTRNEDELLAKSLRTWENWDLSWFSDCISREVVDILY